jgi:hypothetical protein
MIANVAEFRLRGHYCEVRIRGDIGWIVITTRASIVRSSCLGTQNPRPQRDQLAGWLLN